MYYIKFIFIATVCIFLLHFYRTGDFHYSSSMAFWFIFIVAICNYITDLTFGKEER